METPPPIPNRSSLRQKKQHRRSSLSGPNHVQLKPASQEVLSSLIDNLQNLSAHESIAARQSGLDSKRSSRRSSKGVFGAYNHEADETHAASHLHPLDAAIPPVVRPSKRGAPSPSLSPNVFGDSVETAARPNSSGGQWTRREEDDRRIREEKTFLEPRYRKNDRSPSKLGKDQRSKRDSVASRASKEHVTEAITGQYLPSPRNSFTRRTSESIRPGEKRSSDVGDRSSVSFLDDSSPELKPTIVHIPSRRSSKRISFEQASSIAKQPSLGSVGDGKKIPSRSSSIRHSMSGAPSPKMKRTSRYSEKEVPKEDIPKEILDEEMDTMPEPRKQSPAQEESPTESDTVKKIEELNARRASWHQSLPVRKPPSQAQNSVETPSIAIKPSKETLIRAVSTPIITTVSTPIVTIIAQEDHPKTGHPVPEPRKSHLFRKSSPLLRTQSDGVVPTSTSTSTSSLATKPSKTTPKKSSSSKSKRTSRTSSPLPPGAIALSVLGIYDKDILGAKPLVYAPPTAEEDPIDAQVDEFLAAPRLSQKITDPYTGRVIAFSEVGDPDGAAVICCVGMGLTRYLTAFYDDLARTLKLRLITPDRPGVGESDAYVDGSDTPLGWPGKCFQPKYMHFHILRLTD